MREREPQPLLRQGQFFYESNSKGEDDSMLNGPITPITARISSLGVKWVLTALLDLGCIRFLVSPQEVEKLGMRLRKLRKPIAFSRLDRSVTGRVPTTY